MQKKSPIQQSKYGVSIQGTVLHYSNELCIVNLKLPHGHNQPSVCKEIHNVSNLSNINQVLGNTGRPGIKMSQVPNTIFKEQSVMRKKTRLRENNF